MKTNLIAGYRIEKRNVLNELRSSNLTLQQLRLFSLYLAKINPRDISTREVKFKLDDYCRIMGLGKPKIEYLQKSTNDLLSKVVNIPNENGKGYKAFQLFKECVVYEDDKEHEWYIRIDAHDNALPLMFDFQKEYFTYKVWNVLSLKSPNQIRMYEILKQYENLGSRELTINDLRELLGIAQDEYIGRKGWSNFKTRVIDSCKKALKESTDICFEYERGSVGPGGSWQTIIFHIKRNDEYISNLSIEEFLMEKNSVDKEENIIDRTTDLCKQMLNKSKLTGIENNWIRTWVDDYGMTEALVKRAFEDNLFRSHLSLKNIHDTLTKWNEHGIRTIEEADKFCREERNTNIRKAARKTSGHGMVWKTGEEAGIEIPDENTATESITENKENIESEDNGIPSDILAMFEESEEDVDNNVDI